MKFIAFLVLIISALFLHGCEEKQGEVYIRVINKTGPGNEVFVKDQAKEIPVDGKFHPAAGYIETRYVLKNVVWNSVVNWKPTCPLEQLWWTDRALNRYFGEFEKLPGDSYYTLTLDYRVEYSKPFVYSWLKDMIDKSYIYNNVVYTYIDDSKLEYSPEE